MHYIWIRFCDAARKKGHVYGAWGLDCTLIKIDITERSTEQVRPTPIHRRHLRRRAQQQQQQQHQKTDEQGSRSRQLSRSSA